MDIEYPQLNLSLPFISRVFSLQFIELLNILLPSITTQIKNQPTKEGILEDSISIQDINHNWICTSMDFKNKVLIPNWITGMGTELCDMLLVLKFNVHKWIWTISKHGILQTTSLNHRYFEIGPILDTELILGKSKLIKPFGPDVSNLLPRDHLLCLDVPHLPPNILHLCQVPITELILRNDTISILVHIFYCLIYLSIQLLLLGIISIFNIFKL